MASKNDPFNPYRAQMRQEQQLLREKFGDVHTGPGDRETFDAGSQELVRNSDGNSDPRHSADPEPKV